MSEQERDPFRAQQSDVIAGQVQRAAGETGKEPGQQRKHKRYPSEAKRKGRKATYDLDPDVIDAVGDIATKERLPRNKSRVAGALLSYSIAQYRAGHLVLEVEQDGENWHVKAVET